MVSRTRAALAALILTAGPLAGCGSDDAGEAARTVEPTTTAAQEPDADTDGDDDEVPAPARPLAEVVVQLGDLPTGWAVMPPEESEDADDAFCEGHDPLEAIEPVEEAESTYSQGDFGPYLTSLAGRYTDEETARSILDALAVAVDACQSFTETEDGAEITYTFSPLSFPKLGDDTYAARLSATTPFGPLAMDMAFTRVGDHVLAIINGGFGSADSALTETLLRLMVDRI